MKQAAKPIASIEIKPRTDGDGQAVVVTGEWRNAGLHDVYPTLETYLRKPSSGALLIDLSDITGLDVSGAWLLRRLITAQQDAGGSVEMTGSNPGTDALLAALPERLDDPSAHDPPKARLFDRLFAPVGVIAVNFWRDFIMAMHILGSAVRGAQMKFGRASGVSPASIVNQIDHMGVRAVPIILLMSFLIGAIIAQQGAFQLRYFGAEIFVVDLVGILQLREIGVLLTAIMIAGRSGSAITAEVGSMKMREEVDALTVMGLNPIGVLIFPRLVALTVALPLLTIIANFAALFGAATVSWAYSGITFTVFIERLHAAIAFSTVVSGIIKAPFMALIIGIVAAVQGLKVEGSAESLGLAVTSSVVKSIFVVILVDGLFAIFYAAIDF